MTPQNPLLSQGSGFFFASRRVLLPPDIPTFVGSSGWYVLWYQQARYHHHGTSKGRDGADRYLREERQVQRQASRAGDKHSDGRAHQRRVDDLPAAGDAAVLRQLAIDDLKQRRRAIDAWALLPVLLDRPKRSAICA